MYIFMKYKRYFLISKICKFYKKLNWWSFNSEYLLNFFNSKDSGKFKDEFHPPPTSVLLPKTSHAPSSPPKFNIHDL